MSLQNKKLIDLLQRAYSAEKAAAFAKSRRLFPANN